MLPLLLHLLLPLQVDEVKLDVEFFNAYLRDPLRPSMPAAPPGPRAAGAEERAGKRPLEQRREVQVGA